MKKTRIKQLENYVFKNIKSYKISESRKSVHFFIPNFPSYEKLAMTSQFELTRFHDVITRNSIF